MRDKDVAGSGRTGVQNPTCVFPRVPFFGGCGMAYFKNLPHSSEAYAILLRTQCGTRVKNDATTHPASTGGKAIQNFVGASWDSYLETC